MGILDEPWWQTSKYLPLTAEGNEHYARTWIADKIKRGITLTPREELHTKLYNHERILVKELTDLELRAHREELELILFTAKAQIGAIDDEEKERKPKKASGFTRSVNIDETSSNAINAIDARKEKLSLKDKRIKELVAMGISQSDAERMMSPSTVLGIHQKRKEAKAIVVPESVPDSITVVQLPDGEAKAVFNPFAKKVE